MTKASAKILVFFLAIEFVSPLSLAAPKTKEDNVLKLQCVGRRYFYYSDGTPQDKTNAELAQPFLITINLNSGRFIQNDGAGEEEDARLVRQGSQINYPMSDAKFMRRAILSTGVESVTTISRIDGSYLWTTHIDGKLLAEAHALCKKLTLAF